MTHRQKMMLGWCCYRLLMVVPAGWVYPLRLNGAVVAWAGYYANMDWRSGEPT